MTEEIIVTRTTDGIMIKHPSGFVQFVKQKELDNLFRELDDAETRHASMRDDLNNLNLISKAESPI